MSDSSLTTLSLQQIDSIWDIEHSGKRRVCMLMITHRCNLKCSYCYETHKDMQDMSIEDAKTIIRKEAEFVKQSPNFEEIQIDFMGGEPLINFPLIKEVVEWLESGAIDVPWICFASTNGTLIDEEMAKWLEEHHRSLILGASYDGTPQMQSRNRGSDQYKIDLDFFRRLWPDQTFQMTISRETLPHLAEGVLQVQKKGYRIVASLAQGVDWTEEDALEYRRQLQILKKAYLEDLSLKPLNRLVKLLDIHNEDGSQRKQVQLCGSGLNMVTYDIDFKRFGCHMFTPIVTGDRAIGVDDIKWDDQELMRDTYCEECVLRNFCPTCPGFNYKYRGDLGIRDKRWCSLVLAEALTSCEFQIERLSKIPKLTQEDAEHGIVAMRAYEILRHLDLQTDRSPYLCLTINSD